MSSAGSVSHWIGQLKAGNTAAARQLWERYFHRLVGLARNKLQTAPRCAQDEEDVALSAFDSFCRQATAGGFPNLLDRDNLWRLLVVITTHKSVDLVQHQRRQKRGGGKVLDEAALARHMLEGATPSLEQVLSREPAPDFAAQLAEECQRLLGALEGDLHSVALWKMEGHTNDAIAAKLACTTRTVERKLWVIRNLWSKEKGP
jgi:DNA-directed RNA polymerase specialized sigma24 family protein